MHNKKYGNSTPLDNMLITYWKQTRISISLGCQHDTMINIKIISTGNIKTIITYQLCCLEWLYGWHLVENKINTS